MEAGNRIGYIDGLRAVAVLAVVIYHVTCSAPAMAAHVSTTWALARVGNHGVDLFFVLSGFCLSYPTLSKMYDRGQAPFNLAKFAGRRIVRIVPPYYAAVAFFTVLGFVLHRMSIPAPMYMLAKITAGDVTRALVFADGNKRFINAAFWSLPIEFRWYFVFPIALWLWTRSRRAFAFVLFASALSIFTRAYSADMAWLWAFMLGIVAAYTHIKKPTLRRYALPAAIAGLAMCIAVTPAGFQLEVANPIWILTAFALLVAVGAMPWLARVLSFWPLRMIGAASYSIYLTHAPLGGLFQSIGFSPLATIFAVLAIGVVFSVLAERPFIATPLRDTVADFFAERVSRLLKRANVPVSIVVGDAIRGRVYSPDATSAASKPQNNALASSAWATH